MKARWISIFLFFSFITLNLSAQTYTGCFVQKVNAIENDALEYGNSTGDVILNGFGMSIVDSWSNQTIGVRFTEIPVPKGSVIKNAYVQFYCKEPLSSVGTCELVVQAELSPDASPFVEAQKNISSRPRSTAAINWEPKEWRRKEYGGTDERTPDLSSALQEVIDLADWELNNDIAFVITGTGERSANNYFSGNPPELVLEFEAPNPSTPISNIYFNEVAPNGTIHPDETGDFEDWIELYNDNNFPVNIGGLYISDDADEIDKWQIASAGEIPAKGFITLYADKSPKKSALHLDFALNKNGEPLILSQLLDGQLEIIDSLTYEPVPFLATYARANDEIDNWHITGLETPGVTNGVGVGYLELPIADLEEGFYSGVQSINLSHPEPGALLYYSLDGSEPDQNSALYTSPISINSNLTLKAIAYKNGFYTSSVMSQSYLFELPANLPVLMISTDPKNLYDEDIGIFAEGNGGNDPVFTCGENQTANYYQNWERPAHLSFFENDGQLGFSVNAGIRVSGNCSRKYALRSLNLYLRNNQYGDKDIEYELFPDRTLDQFSRLKLRNSGQDYRGTMMRDATNHQIMSNVPTYDFQAYRPTVVYINGEYWGIQNLREKYGSKFFEERYDLDSSPDELDDIDLLKNQEFLRDIKSGDDIHFQNMLNFVADNDLTDSDNFDYLQTQLDINSFMDHWISMLYISNDDWPANNKQIWRPRTPEGKWRWMLLDTDGSTNLSGAISPQGHLSDKLEKVLQDGITGWPNDSGSTLIFRKLMANESFRMEFIQRSCTFMELVFDKERVVPIIDENENQLSDDIQGHLDRWAFDNPNLLEKDIWEDNVNKFRTFYQSREPYFKENLSTNLAVNDSFELTFNYDASTEGTVFIHWSDWEIPFEYSGTYYSDLPIAVKAVAKDGFIFEKWLETGETNAEISFSSITDAVLTPIFLQDLTDATTNVKLPALKITPNPAKDFIQVILDPQSAERLQIINLSTGVIVFEKQVSVTELSIKTEDYAPGVYLCQVLDKDGLTSQGRFSIVQ